MKKMIQGTILLLSVMILFSWSAPAWATTTPSASVSGEVRTPNNQSGPNSFVSASSTTSSVSIAASYTNAEGSPGTLMAFAYGGNSPALSLYGTAVSTLGNYYLYPNYDSIVSNGTSSVNYQYQVSGPSNVSVPVTYSFMGSYSATTGVGGTTGGDAYLSFAPGTYRFSWGVDANGSDMSLLGSHLINGTVAANQWYPVSMYMELYVGENDFYWIWGNRGAGSSTAQESIDPTVTIDPNWLQNNPGYTLQFDTLTPMPAPSALLLLAPGLAGLAAMRRRFKK